MNAATPNPRPFVGLMGMLEMEAALEVIVAKMARGQSFADVRTTVDDYPPRSYEADGFRELVNYGWLVPASKGSNTYVASAGLVGRVRSRLYAAT